MARTATGSGATLAYIFNTAPSVAVASTPSQFFRRTVIRTGSTDTGLWGIQFWNQATGGNVRDYGSGTTPTSVRVVQNPSTGTGVHWEFTVNRCAVRHSFRGQLQPPDVVDELVSARKCVSD